jgi:hypothetical protein
MGLRARNMLDAQFARHIALERWQALLENIAPLQHEPTMIRSRRTEAAMG